MFQSRFQHVITACTMPTEYL